MIKIKILLCDPRHSTVGAHSNYVPIGIGFIGSYICRKLIEDGFQPVVFDAFIQYISPFESMCVRPMRGTDGERPKSNRKSQQCCRLVVRFPVIPYGAKEAI